MIIETLKSFIAFGILGFIIGSFLYKTYKAIRNDPRMPKAIKDLRVSMIIGLVASFPVLNRFCK
jgi:hypothetical protein